MIMKKEIGVAVLHQGVYKKELSMANAVFIITGMTIGAGILGIPYVVAQVGIAIGVAYILFLGFVMMILNLMIGDIASRTKENYQLPGLAGKYLGNWAKIFLSIIVVLGGMGTLLAYIIGEGQTIAVLLGGNPAWWSVFFWSIGSFLVWRGLQTVKIAEKILSIIVIGIICGLSFAFLPQMNVENFSFFNASKFFLPYGVILFALHASPAIAEARALLPGDNKKFRRALVIGTLIPVFVYILFAIAVVGVYGKETTEIATLGFGKYFGKPALLLANLFAILSMGTGFMGLGIAIKQTFTWDYKLNEHFSALIVVVLPLLLFLFGLRSFVSILEVVGGVFLGIEAIMMTLTYFKARTLHGPRAKGFSTVNILFTIPVILVFTFLTVASIIKFVI
jgi:amino acid permease